MNKRKYWTRTTLGIAAAMFVGASSASAAELLLDLQFNEGTGLTSASSVGDVSVNLGTAIDPAWNPTGVLESPSGMANDRAANFDGNGWLLNEFEAQPFDLTQPLTWEGWIYVDEASTKTTQDFFNLGDTFKVGTTSEHKVVFTFRAVEDVISEIVLPAGYWSHLAFSWDPTGSYITPGQGIVKFYQDGIFMGEVETPSAFRDYVTSRLSLGASNTGGSLFQGKMDRIRMHNKVLTETEMDSDAANPKAVPASAVIAFDFAEEACPFVSSTSPKLELLSGTEVVGDTKQIHWSESTPERDIDPTKTDDFSVFVDNSAAAAAGANADKYGYFKTDTMDFGDATDPSFSMEAWFKGLARGSVKQVFFQLWSNPDSKMPRISFAISPAFTVYMTTMGVADIETGVKIPDDGGWHHIACTFDAPGKKISVYVDGELKGVVSETSNEFGSTALTKWSVNFAAQADADNASTPNVDDSNCGMIGCEHTGYAPFSGYVDRLRFWKGVVAQEDLDYQYYGEAIIAPIVATQFSDYKVPAGIKVNLAPKIIGTDTEDFPMSYQWYKDGEAVEGANEMNLSVEVSEATVGSYYLWASNAKSGQGGEVTTETRTISIADPIEYSSNLIVDYAFNEGPGKYTTASSVGTATAVLGTEYMAEEHYPTVSDNSPSGAASDKSISIDGFGYLRGWTDLQVDLTKPVTMETWLYLDPENTKTYEGFLTYGNTLKLGCNAEHRVVFTMSGVEDVVSEIYLSEALGYWTHIAAAWEPGVGVTFYQDGAYLNQTTTTNMPNAAALEGEGVYRVTVGAEAGGNPTHGLLDRVRLHQGLLSEADLDSDPANSKGPRADTVLAFDFNKETTMPFTSTSVPVVTLSEDPSGEAYAAAQVQWAEDSPTGKKGDYSLSFGGTQNATMAIDYLNFDRTDPSFTIESWIKGAPLSNKQIIFANNGPGARFSFSVWTDYSVYLTLYAVADIQTKAMIPQDGKWHHVAITYDYRAKHIYAYVDGVLGDYFDYTGLMLFDNAGTDALIGSEGSNYFVGKIDRLRIHTGVLDPKDLDFYNVDLSSAPVIESVSIPATTVGAEAKLSVTATGTEPLTYQWFLNDVAIEGATEATYTIKDTTFASSGSYTVKVTNAEGGVTSDAKVLVVSSDPSALVKLLDFRMDEGSGLVTASEEGKTVANLSSIELGLEPVLASTETPSGIAGDLSLLFNGYGWLLGDLPEAMAAVPTTPLTWEAWVYRTEDGQGTYEDFFRMGNSIKVGMNIDKLFQVTLLGVVDINSEITVEPAKWIHLAATYEPGVGVSFYKDGVFVNKVETAGVPREYSNALLSLGADNGGQSLYWGKLDRVRVHAALLSAEQLDSEATNPKPPTAATILDYGFNEEATASGAAESYSSVGQVPLTLAIKNNRDQAAVDASRPTWVAGPYGFFNPSTTLVDSALGFSGSTYALFGTDAINFGDTTDKSFSMEAWIKDVAVKESRQVFLMVPGNDAGTAPSVSFSISGSREVFFTTMGVADFNTGVVIPEDSDWHNIAVAWNSAAGIVYVFIDGQLAGTKAYTAGVNFSYPGWWGTNPTGTGSLGREVSGSLPFTGSVDRVKLWKGVVGPSSLDYPPSEPSSPLPPPAGDELTWKVEADTLTLTWTEGSLEVSTDAINWVAIDQASPLAITISETTGAKYYRLAK